MRNVPVSPLILAQPFLNPMPVSEGNNAPFASFAVAEQSYSCYDSILEPNPHRSLGDVRKSQNLILDQKGFTQGMEPGCIGEPGVRVLLRLSKIHRAAKFSRLITAKHCKFEPNVASQKRVTLY